MIYKSLQIVILVAVTATMSAQDVFKVLASRGGSTVKASNSKEWKKVLIGMKIQENDVIKLNQSDYLGLMHITSGKSLELKTPGDFNAKDLASNASKTSSTYSQKYADYVMSAMANNSQDANKNVGGVVYRDVYDIQLDYPNQDKQIVITSRTFDLSWHPKSQMAPYKVSVQNMFDEVLFTSMTSDTSARIDLTSANLGEDLRLKLTVSPSDPSKIEYGPKALNILVNESKEMITLKNDFLSEVKEETALNYLIKAKFFESNNMFIDAVDSYNKAIKIEPKIEEFKQLKERYLLETGAIKPQKKQ